MASAAVFQTSIQVCLNLRIALLVNSAFVGIAHTVIRIHAQLIKNAFDNEMLRRIAAYRVAKVIGQAFIMVALRCSENKPPGSVLAICSAKNSHSLFLLRVAASTNSPLSTAKPSTRV